jgi:serine/threonine protein kinase
MNQLEDKVIFGKYKILKLISEGSFGKVYLAQNIVTKK